MSIEIWRPVVGYENLYEVSSAGSVRSLPRIDPLGRKWHGKMLKLNTRINGYPQVHLCRDRHIARHSAHRLVLSAFVGPCPPGHLGLHKNDVKTDNRVENLYYGTKSQNSIDAMKNGRNFLPKSKFGSANEFAKLSEDDVSAIRATYDPKARRGPLTKRGLAKVYGVHNRQVARILAGVSRQRG